MPRQPASPVGAVLGDRYELLRPIVWGGMPDVFEADDRVLRRKVAVRLFAAATPEERARFEDESRALTERDHPRVYDTGPYGDDAYLVLELGDGGADETGGATVAVPAPLLPDEGDPTGELTAVLPSAAGSTAILPALPPEATSPVPRRSRELPVWGAVIGVAAVLVAVLAFAAMRGSGDDPTPTTVGTTTSTSTTTPHRSTTTTSEVTTTESTTTTEAPTTTTSLDPGSTTTSITLPRPTTTAPAAP